MQIEAETLSMLIWGFSAVILLCIIVIIKLWLGKKDKAYIWFNAQLAFLALAFYKLVNLLRQGLQIPEVMRSEENSLALGMIGVLWTISMICMLMGLWFTGNKKENTK